MAEELTVAVDCTITYELVFNRKIEIRKSTLDLLDQLDHSYLTSSFFLSTAYNMFTLKSMMDACQRRREQVKRHSNASIWDQPDVKLAPLNRIDTNSKTCIEKKRKQEKNDIQRKILRRKNNQDRNDSVAKDIVMSDHVSAAIEESTAKVDAEAAKVDADADAEAAAAAIIAKARAIVAC